MGELDEELIDAIELAVTGSTPDEPINIEDAQDVLKRALGTCDGEATEAYTHVRYPALVSLLTLMSQLSLAQRPCDLMCAEPISRTLRGVKVTASVSCNTSPPHWVCLVVKGTAALSSLTHIVTHTRP